MSTNHLKYLAGEPLNEELAALRAGTLPLLETFFPPAIPSPAAPEFGNLSEPLAKDERNSLREMRLSLGWGVFQKLLKQAIMRHTDQAVSVSQVDPLHNGEAITEAWAYVGLLKRVIRDVNLLVEAETRQEEKKEAAHEDDASV